MKDFQYGGLSPNEILDLLRVQKHDHLNHMQVVLGYLQIGKPEIALNYIKEAIHRVQENGKIFKINAHNLAFVLFNIIQDVFSLGIEPKLSIDTLFEHKRNDLDLCLIVGEIWKTVKAQLHRNIYKNQELVISISEDKDTYLLSFNFSLLDNVILKEEVKRLSELASFLEMKLKFHKNEADGNFTLEVNFD